MSAPSSFPLTSLVLEQVVSLFSALQRTRRQPPLELDVHTFRRLYVSVKPLATQIRRYLRVGPSPEEVERTNHVMFRVFPIFQREMQQSFGLSGGRHANTTRPEVPADTQRFETSFFRRSSEHTHDSRQCGICTVEFEDGEAVVKTTCCTDKFMHANCAVNCLRNSSRCPFCRHSSISF